MQEILTKDRVPGTFWVQEGEISGKGIHWEEWRKEMVFWDEEANPDDEPGIKLEDGGWGFAGWDPEHHIYTRYNTTLWTNALLPDRDPFFDWGVTYCERDQHKTTL